MVASLVYATGNADGGDGNFDLVGQNSGSILVVMLRAMPMVVLENFDYVGGLVGVQGSGGSITASYATGDADGGAGDQ